MTQEGLSVPDAETLIHLAEILDVSVSELLGEKIVDDKKLSDVAEQLAKLNEHLAIQEQRKSQLLRLLKTAVVIFAVLIIISAIYPEWCDIWYDFGKNLYYLFH